MFNSIRVLLTTIFISTIAFADVFITEIADPNNQGSSSSGIGNVRFVELYKNKLPIFKLKVIKILCIYLRGSYKLNF